MAFARPLSGGNVTPAAGCWSFLEAYGCFFQRLEVTPDSLHSKVCQGIFFPDKMSYSVTQGWAAGLLKTVLLMFKGSSLLCRGVVELIVVGSTQAPTLPSAFSSARPSAEQPTRAGATGVSSKSMT